MTFIGKLLVYLNLFVSVVLITWAVSLYVHRLDWIDRKLEDGTTVPGQITRLKKEIEDLTKQVVVANDGYGSRDRLLAPLETEQLYRKAQFDKRLARARSGEVKGPTDGPFKAQLPLKDGPLLKLLPTAPASILIDVDAEGKTVTFLSDTDKKDAPLRGFKDIQADIDREQVAVKTASDAIAKARGEFDTLSKEIKTTDERTEVQKVILANLVEHEKYLGSAQINWDEELRVVTSRKKQLLRRLEDLGVKAEAMLIK